MVAVMSIFSTLYVLLSTERSVTDISRAQMPVPKEIHEVNPL